jgi:hypothetical protein
MEEVKARKADFLRKEREEEEELRLIREAQQAKYDEHLAEERYITFFFYHIYILTVHKYVLTVLYILP